MILPINLISISFFLPNNECFHGLRDMHRAIKPIWRAWGIHQFFYLIKFGEVFEHQWIRGVLDFINCNSLILSMKWLLLAKIPHSSHSDSIFTISPYIKFIRILLALVSLPTYMRSLQVPAERVHRVASGLHLFAW